jgi:hypothetical protein
MEKWKLWARYDSLGFQYLVENLTGTGAEELRRRILAVL